MNAERIAEIAARNPWLPADYLRHLRRVEPGPRAYRYGAQWLDGPQVARDAFGAQMGSQFPSVRLVARRHGQFIGYADWETGRPQLFEWAGSQRQVVQAFDSIASLVLSSILIPGSDHRPVVHLEMQVAGIAFGPWHNTRDAYLARCILLPDQESDVIGALRSSLRDRWCLVLARDDNDSWLSIRPVNAGYEMCLDRHGSGGNWRPASAAECVAELIALAPFNGGCHPSHHAVLSIPLAADGSGPSQ